MIIIIAIIIIITITIIIVIITIISLARLKTGPWQHGPREVRHVHGQLPDGAGLLLSISFLSVSLLTILLLVILLSLIIVLIVLLLLMDNFQMVQEPDLIHNL